VSVKLSEWSLTLHFSGGRESRSPICKVEKLGYAGNLDKNKNGKLMLCFDFARPLVLRSAVCEVRIG
jgi:hypothetical protein